MENLKTCPFCGVRPFLCNRVTDRKPIGADIEVEWYVKCPNCGCMKVRKGYYEIKADGKLYLSNIGGKSPNSRTELIDEWNRRANDSDKIISELQKKQEEQRELYRQTGRDEHILAMSAYAYSETIVKGGVV